LDEDGTGMRAALQQVVGEPCLTSHRNSAQSVLLTYKVDSLEMLVAVMTMDPCKVNAMQR
jgi:hypothetical protein